MVRPVKVIPHGVGGCIESLAPYPELLNVLAVGSNGGEPVHGEHVAGDGQGSQLELRNEIEEEFSPFQLLENFRL